jgi:hypothetical protein
VIFKVDSALGILGSDKDFYDYIGEGIFYALAGFSLKQLLDFTNLKNGSYER